MTWNSEIELPPLLLSYLRDAGVMVLVRIDSSGRIAAIDGAWREVLEEHEPPAGIAIEERIGVQGRKAVELVAAGRWSSLALVWHSPVGTTRALDGRCRAIGDERLLVLSPGVWTEERALLELSKVHEQLTNTERALHRRNRDLEEARARLAQLATRDPLTGLANRRLLDETLDRALSYARRRGEPLCVVAADLDHFKMVNDRHGHAAGDRVLVVFAGLLDGATRREDLAARTGGEEFLLVLPGTQASGGRVVAERLRERIAASDVGPAGPVTASLGVAEFRCQTDTAASLLERVDAALYAAKRAGRNQVVVAGEPE